MSKYLTCLFLLTPLLTWAQTTQYTSPILYSICDDNSDGIISFSLDELEEYALDFLNKFNEQPEVYVTKAYNGIAKVTNIHNNPQVVNVCSGFNDNKGGYYDIAINSNKEIFIVRQYGFLQKIDINNCNATNIGQIHSNGQTVLGLSFDTADNLYEGGWTSKVFRANVNDYNNFYEWHDFGIGRASGDFVMIDGFMYIGWTVGNTDYLYKVTVNDDFQYVSHENLGAIENETYGLAAEYGRLYGVTPNSLYEIDLETLTTNLVVNRPALANTRNNWWGASGFHEALNFNITFHDNATDAVSGNNQINSPYINNIPFLFAIYIRIEDSTSGNIYIIPVEVNVNTNIVTNTMLNECFNESTGYATFTLNDSKPNISDESNVNIIFYESLNDLNTNQNSLNNIYNTTESTTIYAKVESTNGCSSVAELQLIVESLKDLNLNTEISFCKEEGVLLSIPDNYLTYQWEGLQTEDEGKPTNTHELFVTQEGTYTVTVTTALGCTQNLIFTTLFLPSPTLSNVIVIGDSVTVNIKPIGTYEYSLDGLNWQLSNTFSNLPYGSYTVYVRNSNGCATIIHEFYLSNIPNFISPNGDGYNDEWLVPELKNYANSIVQIFDRYGKLIIETSPSNTGFIWNGKYNGSPVPSNTYWYLIHIPTENRILKGYLVLKNN